MNNTKVREADRRQAAWIYLRHVIEGSRPDVLELLWPGGWEHRISNDVPGAVEELARRIYRRDSKLPQAVLDTTSHRADCDPWREWEQASAQGLRLLTPEDAEWPVELDAAFITMGRAGADSSAGVRGQAEAPFALWVRGEGNLAQLVQRSITVVGTRAATRYGRQITHQFSTELAEQGYTIVSGGVEGIDKSAHRAALEAGVPTVVFLACGADVAYPRKNQELFDAILCNGGLVVSEYAPGTPPARHRFLTRNRLAAAVSRATLMVEAPYRSGAINTMNWAEAMLKPCLAVPGPVDVAASQGSLRRIQQGRAHLIRNTQDILEILEPVGAQLEIPLSGDEAMEEGPALSWQETAVFDAAGVEHDATGQLAQIQRDTGLSAQMIVRTVRKLESAGLLRREGDRWVKTHEEEGRPTTM